MARTVQPGQRRKTLNRASARAPQSAESSRQTRPYVCTWPGLVDKYIQYLLLAERTSYARVSFVACMLFILDDARGEIADWADLAWSATKCLFVLIILYVPSVFLHHLGHVRPWLKGSRVYAYLEWVCQPALGQHSVASRGRRRRNGNAPLSPPGKRAKRLETERNEKPARAR